MQRNRVIVIISIFILALLLNFSSSFIKPEEGQSSNEFDTIVVCDPIHVIDIEQSINENSGLIFYRNLFWTFNDSGGDNSFFSFDSLHTSVLQNFIVANAKNVDWESITQDSHYIYIGDFGNNFGDREDMVIYKIPKKYISSVNNGIVLAEEIKFKYEDQTNFTTALKFTEYDCEAFINLNDHLYIFTKDWINRRTKVYKLPKETGEYSAKLIGSFEIDGLVTASDISPDKKTLALLGYKNYTPFMVLYTDFEGYEFFSGKKIRCNFNSIHNAQTEGLTFTSNNIIYISCETSIFNAQLFRLNLNEIKGLF